MFGHSCDTIPTSLARVPVEVVRVAALATVERVKKTREAEALAEAEKLAAKENRARAWVPLFGLFTWLAKKPALVTAQDVLDDKVGLDMFDSLHLHITRNCRGEKNIEAAERLLRLCSVTADGHVLVGGEDARLVRLG